VVSMAVATGPQDTDPTLMILVTIFASVMASSGFWAWIASRSKKQSATTRLLLGVAHDRIIFLGMNYITRGFITKDEYEDFVTYLWEPYSIFGGNGLAEKVYEDLKRLPIVAEPPHMGEVPRNPNLRDKE